MQLTAAAWDATSWPPDSNDPPFSLLLNQSNCSTQKQNSSGSGVDAVTADTVPSSTAGATPVLCHLLSQATLPQPLNSSSPRTNKWVIHSLCSCGRLRCRYRPHGADDDVLSAAWLPAKLLMTGRLDEWRASGDWWVVTGELVNLRQDINFWRTLMPWFKIRTYSYVHLWILDVFGDFLGVIYVHTSTNGSPDYVTANMWIICDWNSLDRFPWFKLIPVPPVDICC